MSVTVSAYGPGKDTDEYQAALRLKGIILDSLPAAAIGEILLYANATLFGQAVKDVDILMVGYLQNYTVNAEFYSADGNHKKEAVDVSSFCTTIEVKRHDISGVFLNGTDLYVTYGDRSHCVTSQSNKQKYSAVEYLRNNILTPIFVTNVIWFTQITPNELSGLLTRDGKIMASNALGREFDFKELVRILISEQTPVRYHNVFHLRANDNPNSLKEINNVLSLFSNKKEQIGELTRRKIEQITADSLFGSELATSSDKVSICRGRAGTGKTVGLIQIAVRLVDEEHARVLLLTYNKALVSDIRRLLAFMELPDMFQANCLHINTMHSYFYRLANSVLFEKKAIALEFISNYEKVLSELLNFISDTDGLSLAQEQCASEAELDWDYVLIDEAQDWTSLERDIILRMFARDRIIVADGGQQFVRGIDVCDWTIVRERNNIKLKYCLRQKENLVSFINSYAQRLGGFANKVLTKNNLPGGKIRIVSGNNYYSVHEQEMEKLKKSGNTAYDMLLLVPHSLVDKQSENAEFMLKSKFEQHGILVWDGTSAKNRESYSTNLDEIRVLQYDSARGLEGWTVVCMDFDQFLKEKDNEYVEGDVNTLLLESKDERKQKYLYNWAMIPLTRAIDTLIITIRNKKSEVAIMLRMIAQDYPDYVSWEC